MADAEVLKEAGLHSLHSTLASTAVFCAVIGGLATLGVWLVEQRAQQIVLQKDGLQNPLWMQSERGLVDLNFKRQALDDGLTLFVREPKPESDVIVPLVEAVIRRDKVNVAVVQVVAVDARESWEFGLADQMTDGSSVADAVSKSNIPLWLAQRADDAIDVIAVGLESRPRRETPPQNRDETSQPGARASLSMQRATALASEFRRVVGFIEERPVRYWTLDLGRATVPSDKGTSLEARQRAAIMVALSRRKTVEGGPVSAQDALALVTTNVRVYGTDLTAYKHSDAPAEHLKPWPPE